MQNSERDPAIQAPDPLPTDLSGAVRTAFNILDAWEASPAQAEAILGLARRTYYAWRRHAPAHLDRDKLERISYVLGIWKALLILFPDNEAYKRWPQLPNNAPLFAGHRPIEIMSQGRVSDLYRVRAWLDGWRGWN